MSAIHQPTASQAAAHAHAAAQAAAAHAQLPAQSQLERQLPNASAVIRAFQAENAGPWSQYNLPQQQFPGQAPGPQEGSIPPPDCPCHLKKLLAQGGAPTNSAALNPFAAPADNAAAAAAAALNPFAAPANHAAALNPFAASAFPIGDFGLNSFGNFGLNSFGINNSSLYSPYFSNQYAFGGLNSCGSLNAFGGFGGYGFGGFF